MIKANELRIGNLVCHLGIDYDQGGNKFHDPDGDVECEIEAISKEYIELKEIGSGVYLEAMTIDNCGFVPLTPEWLVRCGLNTNPYEPDEYPQWSNLHMNIAKYDDGFYLYVTATDPYHSQSVGKKIEYVHQLQNVSLDLYGEELTIEL